MKTLFMDTAWKQLICALFEDGKPVAGVSQEAFKRQSESLLVEVDRLLKEAGWKLSDLDEVILTDGPGSYTGLRIAMTTAKILAAAKPELVLRTLPTFLLYSGKAPEANVLLDARGKRAYAAHIQEGVCTFAGILPVDGLEEFLEANPGVLYGEGFLVSRQEEPSDFLENVREVLPLAVLVEHPESLVPRYFKEQESYLA